MGDRGAIGIQRSGWRLEDRREGVSQWVAEGSGYQLGRFRCGPTSPLWRVENRIRGPGAILVFATRPVEIAQAGHRAVVANPNVAMLYNAGQAYRRRLVHPEGDRCIWLGLSGRVLLDLLGQPDGDPGTPFAMPRAIAPPTALLGLRRLLARVDAEPEPDPLATPELAIEIAARVLAAPIRDPGMSRRHRDAAHALETHLSQRFAARESLTEIAGSVGLSEAHAARVFRRHTGTTLHQYRDRLRLRSALERLGDPPSGGLSEIALDLGYAHHSHLTNRFRGHFGATPSQVSRILQARGARSA